MEMHWILQDKLSNEQGFRRLVGALEHSKISYQLVTPIPFTTGLAFNTRILPYPVVQNPVFVMGGTTLSEVAIEAGWNPGTFLNSNHDFEVWGKFYKDFLLNQNSLTCRFEDVPVPQHSFFLRPCSDNKSFPGKVYMREEFIERKQKILALGENIGSNLNMNTLVCYAPVKNILGETRFFILDGKIVTCSGYIGTGDLSKVSDNACSFAQMIVDIWQPARGFVLDIALTDDGYRVIEVNCLNSSGFYQANVQKLVDSIQTALAHTMIDNGNYRF